MPRERPDPQALPPTRAFVVQFRQRTDVRCGVVDGRIEQISSGEAAQFHSWAELERFCEGQLVPGEQHSGKKAEQTTR